MFDIVMHPVLLCRKMEFSSLTSTHGFQKCCKVFISPSSVKKVGPSPAKTEDIRASKPKKHYPRYRMRTDPFQYLCPRQREPHGSQAEPGGHAQLAARDCATCTHSPSNLWQP
ncbi:hypothetical protein MHYP_G00107740 [Metynnis hypsauchen]